MQSAFRSRIAYHTGTARHHSKHGWVQAGFNSFAYRLAHLCVSRSVAVIGFSLVFYLV